MKTRRARKITDKNDERFQLILQNLNGYIYSTSYIDGSPKTFYHSPKCLEITGYRPLEYLEDTDLWIKMVHPDDRDRIYNYFTNLNKREKHNRVEHRIIKKDGSEVWISNSFSASFNGNGKLERMDGFISDITDHKRLEMRLLRTEKLLALGELSAMIAHEFRNGLTSIKMTLEMEMERAETEEEDSEAFRIAIGSINHLERVVSQLLNYTKSTKAELKPEPVNCIITESLDFLRIEAYKKHVSLKTNLSQDNPIILTHSLSLKEAIINLSINSMQAFNGLERKDKEILVSSETRILNESISDFDFSFQEDPFGLKKKMRGRKFSLDKGQKICVVSVRDNGKGIGKEHLGKIFEPFYTTRPGGSGLGLSSVKRTINSLGGVIKVESTEGCGTLISLWFPMEDYKQER